MNGALKFDLSLYNQGNKSADEMNKVSKIGTIIRYSTICAKTEGANIDHLNF